MGNNQDQANADHGFTTDSCTITPLHSSNNNITSTSNNRNTFQFQKKVVIRYGSYRFHTKVKLGIQHYQKTKTAFTFGKKAKTRCIATFAVERQSQPSKIANYNWAILGILCLVLLSLALAQITDTALAQNPVPTSQPAPVPAPTNPNNNSKGKGGWQDALKNITDLACKFTSNGLPGCPKPPEPAKPAKPESPTLSPELAQVIAQNGCSYSLLSGDITGGSGELTLNALQKLAGSGSFKVTLPSGQVQYISLDCKNKGPKPPMPQGPFGYGNPGLIPIFRKYQDTGQVCPPAGVAYNQLRRQNPTMIYGPNDYLPIYVPDGKGNKIPFSIGPDGRVYAR